MWSGTIRKVSPREVEAATGYGVGALPPVGHKRALRVVIDRAVMEKEFVYGGGGSVNALLEISPRDIEALTRAKIADISRQR